MRLDWRSASEATFTPKYWKWAVRARQAASLINERWVCDLGCGQQSLKWLLARGAVYLPADLHKWTPDTEVCDLDVGQFPERSLAVADVAVMLGVLEHLRAPEKVLSELSRRSEFLVVSLNPRESNEENFRSRQRFADMLERHSFHIIGEREYFYQIRRMLFKARNDAFTPEMRERREVEKSAYCASPQRLGELRRAWHRVKTFRYA